MYWDTLDQSGGFSFQNYNRNQLLKNKPKIKSTGTTIVGVLYSSGVIISADSRATEGPIVADPDCVKLHYLAPNIYVAGAGVAADTEMVSQMVSSELELQRLYTGRQSRMSHVEAKLTSHLFRYQGHIGAALIIGGVDVKGPQLINISPHGNSFRAPFVTMGSGSLAAMSILESEFKENMTKEEAINLATKAIEAGIFNDLYSGSNVNVFIITEKGMESLRHHRVYDKKEFHDPNMHSFQKGETKVIEEVRKNWKNIEVENAKMDLE